MEDIRRIAFETVLRACLFASLAIFCVMVGMSFLPSAAFQAGGFLTLIMTGVLFVKALEARTKDHRRTEMWLYLSKEQRPPARHGAARDVDDPARDLPHVCAMELGDCHCHVGRSPCSSLSSANELLARLEAA